MAIEFNHMLHVHGFYQHLSWMSNMALQYLPPLLLGVCKDENQDEIVIPALQQLACILLLS